MELHSPPPGLAARPAATVVMLRDGAAGLEVFLVKRHGLSDVLAGAYVFPGGKVDPEDALLDMALHLDCEPRALHQRLGEDGSEQEAAGLFVAAMREAFEETGVLFVRGADAAVAARAWALLREGLAFDELLAQLGLRLAASALLPWSRWITPLAASVISKRFDTRFFVTAVPPGQQARHDEREAVDSAWMPPAAALRLYWDGAIALAPPQIMSLVHLARHATVSSVLVQARGRTPPVIQPEPFEEAGGRVVCYPGDERHPVRERALPGPTRLHYREGRFEPAGGLQALLG